MTTSGHEQDVKEYEFSPVGHITIDANGRIIELNIAAGKMLGLDQIDLIGRKYQRLLIKLISNVGID